MTSIDFKITDFKEEIAASAKAMREEIAISMKIILEELRGKPEMGVED